MIFMAGIIEGFYPQILLESLKLSKSWLTMKKCTTATKGH
jgi:hypothetical protein